MENVIKRAMDALERKDPEGFAACFSEDGRLFDYCPSLNGSDSYFSYGNACIELFYRNRFYFDHLVVSCPLVEDENTASYFGAYDGPYIFARFRIEVIDENGLIRRAVVHPA
jgi:hypothetical protein